MGVLIVILSLCGIFITHKINSAVTQLSDWYQCSWAMHFSTNLWHKSLPQHLVWRFSSILAPVGTISPTQISLKQIFPYEISLDYSKKQGWSFWKDMLTLTFNALSTTSENTFSSVALESQESDISNLGQTKPKVCIYIYICMAKVAIEHSSLRHWIPPSSRASDPEV